MARWCFLWLSLFLSPVMAADLQWSELRCENPGLGILHIRIADPKPDIFDAKLWQVKLSVETEKTQRFILNEDCLVSRADQPFFRCRNAFQFFSRREVVDGFSASYGDELVQSASYIFTYQITTLDSEGRYKELEKTWKYGVSQCQLK